MEEENRFSGSPAGGGERSKEDGTESWTEEGRRKGDSHTLGVQQVKALLRRNIIVSYAMHYSTVW